MSERQLPSNVLVIRFSALGDVCMAIPIVYSVCRAYPGIRFVFLTKPAVTGLFVNPPSNLAVEGADVKHEYSGVTGIRRLFHAMREKYAIDAVADLHDVLRTRMIDIFCMLRGMSVRRIDKGRRDKRMLTRSTNKALTPLVSSSARYIDVFFNMGFRFSTDFISLFGEGKGEPSLFSEITAAKKTGEKWVAIAPFAAHKAKIYPTKMLEEVVKALYARKDVRLFFFGAGNYERDILCEWVSRYPGTVSLAEKRHGFGVELALLSHMDAMVSMDSANMHLASLVNVPVISVWGATHPYCGFEGWRQDPSLAVQLPLGCRPCSVFGNKECMYGDYSCLIGIDPRMIVDKVVCTLDCGSLKRGTGIANE